jgi:flagellar protein FliS
MYQQGYTQYRTIQAHTADRGELVVMLYEGAIKFLGRASIALEARNIQETHNNLIRSQNIIIELMNSLNMEAGDIAHNLFRIYEYMYFRLVQANCKKEPSGIEEVTGLLRELLPAWQAAAKSVRANQQDMAPVAENLLRHVAV